jgi:glycosyl transferase family 87
MRIKGIRVLLAVLVLMMLGDFVYRGFVPALTARKNDFSDPFIGAWLWRHGENPYDSALAETTSKQLVGSRLSIVPIYPPTTYLLAAPLSLLPWRSANLCWAALGLAGVGTIAWSLVHIGRFTAHDDKAWFITAIVFTFRPLHTALNVGNAAVVTTALCLLALYLAGRGHDMASGAILAIATCLKPHFGLWILAYYLVQRRWRVVATSVLVGVVLAVVAVARIPLTLPALVAGYRGNLHYWFGPGGENDFTTANPSRFPLVNLQTALYPFVHSAVAANALAYAIFILGAVIWVYAVLRGRLRSDALAISSLLALSFLSVYHRVNDAGILTLALCWGFKEGSEQLRQTRRLVVGLVLMLAAGQSVLARSAPHLPSQVTGSSWWNLGLVPYFVWILFALSGVLLYAVVVSARSNPPHVAAG